MPAPPGAPGPAGRTATSGVAPIPRGEAPVRADGTPVRFLVVDDEPDLADVLFTVLRGEGFDVAVAHTGSAAVRPAEATPAAPSARTCRAPTGGAGWTRAAW